MTDDYKIPLSEFVKKIMFKVMRNSTEVIEGFITFRHRLISKVYYDEEACDKLLEQMVINKNNVLTYLNRKYIPTYNEEGASFKDQKCIQKVKVKPDETLIIHIANSEPHKIITDTIHVMKLLKGESFSFKPKIKYYVDQIKISIQDVWLYNHLITEFGWHPPYSARELGKQLYTKYGKLEVIAAIKQRSVKRKLLRYHFKVGNITWKDLREILTITDFSERNIRLICKRVRQDAIDRGVEKINF